MPQIYHGRDGRQLSDFGPLLSERATMTPEECGGNGYDDEGGRK